MRPRRRHPWITLGAVAALFHWAARVAFAPPPVGVAVTDQSRQYRQLNQLAEHGKVEEARKVLEGLLAERPSFLSARMLYNTGIKACANAGNLPEAERLWEMMQREGIHPNQKGFGKMIEAAANSGNLSAAEQWYARMIEVVGSDMYTFNILIAACAKAQNTEAAERWFQELIATQQPNRVAFTSMVDVGARTGNYTFAQAYFEKAKEFGINLDPAQLVLAAGRSLELEKAEELFAALPRQGLLEYKHVIDAAARQGNLTRAEYWFDRAVVAGVSVEDQAILNTIMFAAARCGNLAAAERWMERVRAVSVPSSQAYTALITAAANAVDLPAAERWLHEARSAVPAQPELYTAAITAASRCGRLDAAEKIAALAEEDGVALESDVFMSLIMAASNSQDFEAAQRWFERAANTGLDPAVIDTAIRAAARANNLTAAEGFFRHFRRCDLEPDGQCYIGLVTAACRAGNETAAEHHFNTALAAGHTKELPQLYTSMINCAARAGDLPKAEMWLQRAEGSGIAPNICAFNSVITAMARHGNWGEAQRWLNMAKKYGEVPDARTYTALITAAAKKGYDAGLRKGNLLDAKSLLEEALSHGVQVDIILMNSVLNAASRAGCLQEAEEVFQAILEEGLSPTIVTYNSLIDGALRAGDVKAAEQWLQRCKDKGLRVKADTMTPFLAYAGRIQDLDMAERWLDRMLEDRVKPDLITYSTLMSTASRAGKPDLADVWLNQAKAAGLRPNKLCYAAVMNGYAQVGNSTQCLRRLTDMELAGQPAGIMELNLALKACARATPPDRRRATLVLEMISERRLHADMMTVRHLKAIFQGLPAAKDAAGELGISLEAAEMQKTKGREIGSRQALLAKSQPKLRRGQQRIYLQRPGQQLGRRKLQ